MNKLKKILLEILEASDVSDIHVSEPTSIWVRRNNSIQKSLEIKDSIDIKEFLVEFLSEERFGTLVQGQDIDVAFTIGQSRVRANICSTHDGLSLVARRVAETLPTIRSIGIPNCIITALKHSQGLILITGPTGSGKSTSMASLIHEINLTQSKKVISIEDPIEFIHSDIRSHIVQRELGQHFTTPEQALKSALRQDPDTLVIGEMREPETIKLALTAAETGHLVLATMHASSASRAITRILDTFSDTEQTQIRAQLSQSLSAVMAQKLKLKNNGNLQGIFETLVCNKAVQNLIRENKIFQIDNVMELSSQEGMKTMAQAEKEFDEPIW